MFKSKVFIRFISSYVIVLLIPLIILSVIIYTTFAGKLTKEVTGSTRRMLTQVSDIMDMRLNDLSNLSERISGNTDLKPIFAANAYNFEVYPMIYDGIKALQDYKYNNSIIENIFIFNRNTDLIVGDTGKYNYSTYAFNGSSWNYIYSGSPGNHLDIIKKVNHITVLPSQPAVVNGTKANVIFYMQPLPVNGGNCYTGTLLITIRESAIQKLIRKILGDYSGHIFIIDSDENMIVGTRLGNENEDEDDGKKAFDLALSCIDGYMDDDRQAFSEETDGSLISCAKSELTGWKYIAVMDSRQVLKQVDSVKSIFIVILCFAFLIGLGFAMYFSKGNYSNIRKITDNILKNKGCLGNDKIFKNEWNFIDSAVSDYIDNTKSLQQKLADQMPIIRNDFLLRLIKGELTDNSAIRSLMEFCKVNLDSPYFAVIYINIDDYDVFRKLSSEPAQGVARITIANTAEELCSRIGNGYAVELSGDRIALIAALNNNSDDALNSLFKDIPRYICAFAKEHFGFTVTVTISGVHEKPTSLNAACRECESAFHYKILKGNNSIICFDEVARRIDNINFSNFYTFEQEKRIIRYLRQGQYEEIRLILDDIIDRIKNNPISLEVVKCLCFEIINTAIKSLHELGMENIEYYVYLKNIIEKESIDELYNNVCGFYSMLCDKVNRAKCMKNDAKKQQAIQYINDHYNDSSLSIDSIADVFSVSSPYMGKLIRDQLGCSFVDYLDGIRIEKAKELLCRSNMSIAEIAKNTGFNSAYNFTRVFKRYEDITPGQFRLSRTAT